MREKKGEGGGMLTLMVKLRRDNGLQICHIYSSFLLLKKRESGSKDVFAHHKHKYSFNNSQ